MLLTYATPKRYEKLARMILLNTLRAVLMIIEHEFSARDESIKTAKCEFLNTILQSLAIPIEIDHADEML